MRGRWSSAISIIVLLCSVLPGQAAETITNLENKLQDVQDNLEDKRKIYDNLQNKIVIYKENLETKQQEELTLTSQLEVLDQDITLTETEIEQTTTAIESLGLEIEALQIKINDAQNKIDAKKNQISSLIRDLYNYDQRTYLEIALTNTTLSDFSSQVEYTEKVNQEFKSILDTLQALKKDLKQDKQDLSTTKLELEDKQVELKTRQESLQGEVDYKENLLTEVEQDEEKFQQLIDDIQAEQAQYNAEISSLEKSARTTLDKLNDLQGTGNRGEHDSSFTLPSEFNPSWPVTGVITTTFHDPGYIFRRYFEHDAIDIAAPQGTNLKAADSGVVAIVKYDGTPNYAYIMIVHANNFATIYGHVSRVYVEADATVQKGQVIAAVGGFPGTTGAGRFTTGSHVHFGVRLNGIPVDPLLYLP